MESVILNQNCSLPDKVQHEPTHCWCGKPLRYTWFAGQNWLICSGSHGTAYGPDAKRLEWEEPKDAA